MNTKLTLRLEDKLVERAKAYARTHGKSVSELVADYFALLNSEGDDSMELPPLTRALHGALADQEVFERDYEAHLDDKYLNSAD